MGVGWVRAAGFFFQILEKSWPDPICVAYVWQQHAGSGAERDELWGLGGGGSAWQRGAQEGGHALRPVCGAEPRSGSVKAQLIRLMPRGQVPQQAGPI